MSCSRWGEDSPWLALATCHAPGRTISPWRLVHSPHFTTTETESQKGAVTSPRSQSQREAEAGSRFGVFLLQSLCPELLPGFPPCGVGSAARGVSTFKMQSVLRTPPPPRPPRRDLQWPRFGLSRQENDLGWSPSSITHPLSRLGQVTFLSLISSPLTRERKDLRRGRIY